MGIQFILGVSGSGKSTYIYNTIIKKSIADESGMYYLIVPEQYTLEAQRDIVTMHPNRGTMNIDAIGFNRLAYRVFDELGINTGQILTDFGKSMLVKKIMWDNRDRLKVYGSSINKMGFIDEMKSMMSELFQYSVDRDSLEQVKNQLPEESPLYQKLSDLTLIYQEFEKFTGDAYIVAEQLIEMLADCVKNSEIIAGSTFYIDGFTGFTPVQMKLIAELIKYAEEVIFSFTIDTEDISVTNIKNHELFYLTKTTMKQIMKLAANQKIEIAEPVLINSDANRFVNAPDISWLEKNIFRYPYKVKTGSLHNIELIAADNSKQEIYFIASEIIKLVFEKGYRYQDIAVVTGDLNSCSSLFSNIMGEYKIPIFIDANEPLKNNPCSEVIRSVLAIFFDDFSYDSVFRFLKTGMTSIGCEDIEQLENYILKRGIRGRSYWYKSFCSANNSDNEDIKRLDIIRQEFLNLLVDISAVIDNKESTVKDYTIALYEFINSLNIYDKLMEHSEELSSRGDLNGSDVYKGIYQKIIDLFDKSIELLGSKRMDIREYYEIIDAGLSSIEIGTVPPTIDRVLIGDITRSRLNHIRVLFFAGMNDGIIPKPAKRGRILNDTDRNRLLDKGLELAPSDRQNAYIEQFYLYINITKASDKLYLSYRKADSDGKSIKPSYVINRIMHIFPDLQIRDFSITDEYICTPEGLLRRLLRTEDNGRYRNMLKEHSYNKEIFALEAGKEFNIEESALDKNAIELLYGKELVQSVSRLETFAGCSFAYFMRYGLGLKERQLYNIDVRNVGNILHQVMEQVFKEVRDYYNNDWQSLNTEERNEMVDKAVALAAEENGGSFFADMERNQYMLKILGRMARRSIWSMQKQLQSGVMRPEMIEKTFDTDKDQLQHFLYQLSDNMSMRIMGKIDRVDVYQQDENVYFKVIDYKSSSKDLDADLIKAGLQLQLLTYSAVAYELEQNIYPGYHVVPAGLLYYTFDDPIIECQAEPAWDGDQVYLSSGEDVEDKRLEKLAMSGFINNNSEIINHIDSSGRFLKPVKYNKDGSVKANKSLKSENELIEMMNFTGERIGQLGKQIAEGDIAVRPVKIKGNDQCKYCDFSNICMIKTKK